MASSPDEKGAADGAASPAPAQHESHHQHHPHLHHVGRRLRQFVRPDGRRVHIAATPEDHERMRRQLSASEDDSGFDLIIHGSPEHLEAIRELHAHHEGRRDTFREQYSDLYEEFENVKAELDALSTELHMLSEHGVALDANFSKFGYSARLRTKDVDSSNNSLSGDHSFSHGSHDWDAERRHGEVIRFWKRPVVRQYFHKGLLWRSGNAEEVASYELFVDLLYVGIIGVIGDTAVEDPTGASFLHFLITFTIGWKIWSDVTLVISWFEADDVFQRLCVLFVMVCLFGYTTNIQFAFDTTYTSLIGFYMAHRAFGTLYYLFCGFMVPTVRGTMVGSTFIVAICMALWIGSIHVEYPRRLGLIFVALVLDLFGGVTLIATMRRAQASAFKHKAGWLSAKLEQWFEFYPAVNIEHKTERTNAFVTLVFGYSVLAILYQSRAAYGINAFFGKAILGLMQAFAFNWIYFEIDAYNLHVHAIRRHYLSSMIWISGHLPFIMGYVLAASTLSRLVLAHDCSDADPNTLGETYAARSGANIDKGLRWYYCGGLGVALISMGLISLSHIHKTIPNARLRKRPRLIVRLIVAVIIICLANVDSLSSLDLISITTALVIMVLWLDIYGNSCQGDAFWTGGFCKTRCRYSAECRIKRREMERALKNGEKVRVEDVAKHDGEHERGFYDMA